MSDTIDVLVDVEDGWVAIATNPVGLNIKSNGIGRWHFAAMVGEELPAEDLDGEVYEGISHRYVVSFDGIVYIRVDTDEHDFSITSDIGATIVRLTDGYGNPINSLKGAIDIHPADVHDVPVNELFHRHTGVDTTLAAPALAGATSITVVNDTGFADGNTFQIEETVDGVTAIEVTFPTIVSGVGTNTFILDRPLDNTFGDTATVEVVTTDMAVLGTIADPVAFQLIPDSVQEWHIVRFLLGMTLDTAADDSRFGNIAGGLPNGCILRAYDGATDRHRTFTNWKTNLDIKMDMFDLLYTDKAGAGNFGVNGRGSIRDGTGATPKLNGLNGSYLELLIQDDLTGLILFNLKGQGHIEGL